MIVHFIELRQVNLIEPIWIKTIYGTTDVVVTCSSIFFLPPPPYVVCDCATCSENALADIARY